MSFSLDARRDGCLNSRKDRDGGRSGSGKDSAKRSSEVGSDNSWEGKHDVSVSLSYVWREALARVCWNNTLCSDTQPTKGGAVALPTKGICTHFTYTPPQALATCTAPPVLHPHSLRCPAILLDFDSTSAAKRCIAADHQNTHARTRTHIHTTHTHHTYTTPPTLAQI
jgi:hypothetical protein